MVGVCSSSSRRLGNDIDIDIDIINGGPDDAALARGSRSKVQHSPGVPRTNGRGPDWTWKMRAPISGGHRARRMR